MQNDDVYTLGGRGVVDAPQRLAQTQESDTLTNMLHDVQSSWMRQNGDSVTQTGPGGNSKCGGYIPPDWDFSQGIPKCGGGTLPEMEIFGQNGPYDKPRFPHDPIKPWFRGDKESQDGYDFKYSSNKGKEGFGKFDDEFGGYKHGLKNYDKLQKGCVLDQHAGNTTFYPDGTNVSGKPDLTHPTVRRSEAYGAPAMSGGSSVESRLGQAPRESGGIGNFFRNLFGRNENQVTEKHKEGSLSSHLSERKLTESERIIEQKMMEHKLRELKLRERYRL